MNPYKKLSNIPPHVFRNRILTEPVGKDFRNYLRYMLDNHPDDLAYIHKHSQKYVNHGGAWVITFTRWRDRLENNLQKYHKEDSL